MSVSHETTESSSTFWSFAFGNLHNDPATPGAERPIFPFSVVGLQGEAHLVDSRKGRELVVEATYAGYASRAALITAFDGDDSQSLLGELLINSVSYGNATFLGCFMTRSPQQDGKNGLWFVDAVLRWRLRT